MEEENETPEVTFARRINMGNKAYLDKDKATASLMDSVYDLAGYSDMGNKAKILQAINTRNRERCIDISNFYYNSSGIYKGLIKYLATQYRYDLFVTPFMLGRKKERKETIIDSFMDCLFYLDEFEAKKFFSGTSKKVLRDGAYYGYRVESKDGLYIQELPAKYCRNLYTAGKLPVIEMNVDYFDREFSNRNTRDRILKIMPVEIQKGYKKLGKGELELTDMDKTLMSKAGHWIMLDPKKTVKFGLEDGDMPPMMEVIPALIDLEEAKEMDKLKMRQNLSKIIIQKFDLDANTNMKVLFDDIMDYQDSTSKLIDEKTVGDTIVISTVAETTVEDMSDTNSSKTIDDLERMERGVYNESGVSQMQFNTGSNTGLQNSTNNDEARLYELILQYESFLNSIIKGFNTKKVKFNVQILSTTRNNYIELAKLYKEHTQIGFSKMLPQIALGQSQSSILATADFENDILDLVNKFIPPRMSSTMSGDEVGAPKKDDNEKADKTIANDQSDNRKEE